MTLQPKPLAGNPELLSAPLETSDTEEFERFLEAMLDSTSGAPAVDFVNDTIEGMEKEGIALTSYRLYLILKHAFGSPDSLLETLRYMTSEEFHTKYPEPIGKLIEWYIEPLLPDIES